MKKLLFVLIFIAGAIHAQTNQEIKLNPKKIQQFTPYLEWKHGGKTGFQSWKENNKILYAQEMWYYSESFYIKRDHVAEGVEMNEALIDISRYENFRKETEESLITIPGFKDAIVLLPNNKLIYKPH